MSAPDSRIVRPTAERLTYLYTDLGLGCPDIGWLYGRDPSTVRHWLLHAGIKTRPRGSDPAQHFKPGHKLRVGMKSTPATIEKVRAATIARGAVPYLRNGQHWLKGARPEDNPRWAGGATPERQEFYRTPEWKAACRSVWARADACCERCGLDYRTVNRNETPKFHVHHVWSFQIRETRAHPALLVLLCRPCHLFVHSNANTTREFLPQEVADDRFVDIEADMARAIPAEIVLQRLNAGVRAYHGHQSAKNEASTQSLMEAA